MNKKISETEAEQFISSCLAFITEQAERFNTTEEFIEDIILELILLIKNDRLRNSKEEFPAYV